MKQSELFEKVYHGEEGHLNMSFDDCKTIAKLLVDRGYAVMFTGGDLDNEYRIDWVYAGDFDSVDHAERSNVCFGLAEIVEMLEFGEQMLEFGEHEKDEEDNDDSKKGHWIIVYNDNKPFKAICSNCAYTTPIDVFNVLLTRKECPRCKIKMDEVEDETEDT